MINEKIEIWKKEEYHYPAAHGFIPVMFSYIHEDEKKHPAMIIAPGGAYREVSPSEAHLPAMEFYGAGYNVFVLEYTINQLDEAPLKMQPLHDISRAIRMIRSRERNSISDQTELQPADSQQEHICVEAFVYIIKMWKIRKKHTRTYPTAQMWRFCLIRSSLQENMHTEIHLSHCLEKSRQSRNWTICRWKIM